MLYTIGFNTVFGECNMLQFNIMLSYDILLVHSILRNHLEFSVTERGETMLNSTTHSSCKDENPNTNDTLDHITQRLVTETFKSTSLT